MTPTTLDISKPAIVAANDAQEIPPRAMVHLVCPSITGRDLQKCRKCPPWENDPDHGLFMRGCYGLAREVVNLIQTGSAWRKPPDAENAHEH